MYLVLHMRAWFAIGAPTTTSLTRLGHRVAPRPNFPFVFPALYVCKPSSAIYAKCGEVLQKLISETTLDTSPFSLLHRCFGPGLRRHVRFEHDNPPEEF